MDDDGLNRCLNDAPAHSIILLEDIDALFTERDAVDKHRGHGISFSGLLNALDGVRSQEGRIIFMTTNHKERLDPALLRPGRADVHVKLNYAMHSQMEKFFLRFFEGETDLAKKFANQLPENKLSMAALQEHMMVHRLDAQKCSANAKLVLKSSSEVPEMPINEWLYKLNLMQYIPKFTKLNIFFVSDVQTFCEDGNLGGQFAFRED